MSFGKVFAELSSIKQNFVAKCNFTERKKDNFGLKIDSEEIISKIDKIREKLSSFSWSAGKIT